MSRSDAAAVGRLLASLDRRDRLIVLLHYADGLSTLEIGRLLNLSASAITRKLATIRDAARSAIERCAEPTVPVAFA